ncbi:hypothetical protein O3689_02060 [Prevotella nigrescens]|uniref:hypothetical protein n=1 Tax=Prevotella nigrescens TaxID=28133 RepID=UPI00352C49CD
MDDSLPIKTNSPAVAVNDVTQFPDDNWRHRSYGGVSGHAQEPMLPRMGRTAKTQADERSKASFLTSRQLLIIFRNLFLRH